MFPSSFVLGSQFTLDVVCTLCVFFCRSRMQQGSCIWWVDNFAKTLGVGVPRIGQQYFKVPKWTALGLKLLKHPEALLAPLQPGETLMPEELFEDIDIDTVKNMLCQQALQLPGFDASVSRLLQCIPLVLDDGREVGGGRKVMFAPRCLVAEDVQSNRGLRTILEGVQKEMPIDKVNLLLVDVGIFDRAMKVKRSSSSWRSRTVGWPPATLRLVTLD